MYYVQDFPLNLMHLSTISRSMYMFFFCTSNFKSSKYYVSAKNSGLVLSLLGFQFLYFSNSHSNSLLPNIHYSCKEYLFKKFC